MRVPDDDFEKFLSDEKSMTQRKKALIDELLRQREAAIKSFDEKLAKLGHVVTDNSDKSKRSHHKKSGGAAAAPKEGKG